jgi:hypothetical protein
MDHIKDHPLYRKHNIDSAMSSLWEFYKARFFVLFIISLVMSGLIQYATSFTDLKDLQSTTDPMILIEKLKGLMLPLAIFALISLLFNVILHHYILHAPLGVENALLNSLWKSARYFVPYLIIMVILSFAGAIALVLGIMVLIIGVFFSLTYIVMISFFILPVMMVEESSIDVTIMRSIRLAHRSFWPNMGWTAVFIILFVIISIVLSGLVLLPFAGSFMSAFANPDDTSKIMTLPSDPLFLLLSSAVNALTLPLFPIFAFIIYFNGRAQEDNVNIHTAGRPEEYKVRVEDLYAKPREDNDNVS